MGLSKTKEASLLIDEQLLQYMDQLELLQEKRATLNALIEQYASEMEPQICVQARTVENDAVEFCTERITVKNPVQNTAPVEDIGPKEEGVRRRIKPSKDTSGPEECVGGSTEKPSLNGATEPPSVSQSDPSPHPDPLRWFGILVPQTLRQAQSSFRQVIELSAEMATLQAAVLNTREQLKHCMKLCPLEEH
ncbi:hypothetical protein NHX12_012633 [Muraenolepis orangiensis]|uniref:Vacuolar ATPase assembly protein VMA22 n=1 Tax=Muraenolepis orangiensis TaxID=630683 RepID=A0A9Q0DER3_9TELE|nr:hypothetical protein NHX12_012633 [Muraenolepis orangiensis]